MNSTGLFANIRPSDGNRYWRKLGAKKKKQSSVILLGSWRKPKIQVPDRETGVELNNVSRAPMID